eukprot:8285349-Pyramimonas_sp.AAC.2
MQALVNANKYYQWEGVFSGSHKDRHAYPQQATKGMIFNTLPRTAMLNHLVAPEQRAQKYSSIAPSAMTYNVESSKGSKHQDNRQDD